MKNSKIAPIKSAKNPNKNTLKITFLYFLNESSIFKTFKDNRITIESTTKLIGIAISQVIGINSKNQIGKNTL
jgi:hypothetical protein